MIRSKRELESFLNECQNNYALTALGLTLIANDENYEVIKNVTTSFGRHCYSFDQFIRVPREKLAESIYKLSIASLRRLITESYEAIKTYAEATGQIENMRMAGWYRFARVIRNAYDHDFHVEVREKEKKHFPVVWKTKGPAAREIRIEEWMHGWPIDVVNRPGHEGRLYVQFTYEDALDLFDDFRSFVKEVLNDVAMKRDDAIGYEGLSPHRLSVMPIPFEENSARVQSFRINRAPESFIEIFPEG